MKTPLYLFTLFFFWCCVSKNDRQAMTDISGMREVVFDDKNTINIDSVIANYRFVRLDSTDNFRGALANTYYGRSHNSGG